MDDAPGFQDLEARARADRLPHGAKAAGRNRVHVDAA